MIVVVEIALLRVEILPKTNRFLIYKNNPHFERRRYATVGHVHRRIERAKPSPFNPIRFKRHEDSKLVLRKKAKKGKNINRTPILRKPSIALARMALRARRPTVGAVLPRRTRWPAIRAVLSRSTRPPLRTRRPAPALLPGTITRCAPVVARPPVSRNTAPHTLAPRARAESVHHHAGLADGAACSASAEGGVAG
jgi:hypothetical protein